MLGHWLRFRSMLSWLCIAPNPSTDKETCHANLNRNYPRSKFEISANTHTRKYNNIQSSCLNAIYHCSRNMDLKLFKCMWSKFIYKCSSFDRKCILKTLYGKVGLLFLLYKCLQSTLNSKFRDQNEGKCWCESKGKSSVGLNKTNHLTVDSLIGQVI